MKIRIGKDFVFNWAIERGGLPEDLSSVLEKHLYLSVFGKRVELIEDVDYDITGNVIRIEVTPAIANIIGTYKAEFHYILPDNGLIDEDRKCAVDVDAFQIVAKTAQADDSTEFSMTSDMAIALKGDKGDSAYQVWLEEGNTGTEEDYFAYLRQPAIDAGASISELEGEIQVSEGLRVSAESERDLAEATRIQSESERLAAEIIRQSNEGDRIENEATRVQNEAERISKENIRQSNEIDRIEAEDIRVQAENERVQAESERQITIQEAVTATNLANEKANLANTAAQSANEAVGLADTARTELTTAVNTKLGEADDKIEEMDTTLSTYDGRVTQVESDISQLAGELKVNIKNEMPNGSFEGTISGWKPAVFNTPRTAFAKSGQQSAGTVLAGGSSTTRYGQIEIQTTIGDVYYAKAWAYIITVSANMRLAKSDGGSFFANIESKNFDIGLLNQWQPASLVFTATTPYTRITLGNTALTSDVTEIYYDDIQLFNLSSVFGHGNEPTLEEFELLLQMMDVEYFEGEITIQQRYLMQWQLALIRKNKNAIIALGGTII